MSTTTKSTGTTQTIHDLLIDYFTRLEEADAANRFAVGEAERKQMDKSGITQLKKDNKNSVSELMHKADDSIKTTITATREAAQEKATALMSDNAMRQLEALKLRSTASAVEVEGMLAAYGTNYQFRVTLRDILSGMGVDFSVEAGELEPYAEALIWLQRFASARVWSAGGTVEKDISSFESDWLLQRMLTDSAINRVDALEAVFDGYLG